MSDQELDELFKNASEKDDSPYDPNDWEKLAVRLEKETGHPNFWNWKIYLGLSVLVLTGVVTSVILIKNADLSTKNDFVNRPTKESMANKGVKNENNQSTENSDGSNTSSSKQLWKKEIVTSNTKQPGSIDRAKQTNEDLIIKMEQSLAKNETVSFSEEKPLHVIPNKDHKIKRPSSNIETDLVNYKNSKVVSINHENEKLVNGNSKQLLSEKNANPLLANVVIAESLSEIIKQDSVKTKFVINSVVISDTTKVASNFEKKKKKQIHHIGIKLNASPDYSSIGYYSPDQSGYNLGATVEYSLTPHWSVSSGGIWTKKIYSGNDIAYPYKGKMINADRMNGNCRMLDWPVNVNYYFTPTNRLGIYVSAGLSSYFMFNENYTYENDYGTTQYYHSEEIKQKESEWFKMTNMSFGLQYRLNHRWSLQAEPFAKIPLAGVGHAKLNLVSGGIFFNIKYTFK